MNIDDGLNEVVDLEAGGNPEIIEMLFFGLCLFDHEFTVAGVLFFFEKEICEHFEALPISPFLFLFFSYFKHSN